MGADPLVLAGSVGVMIAITWIATFVPALAASRSEPNMLLRAE